MNRIFRNRLALTTILAAAPFLGYGRQAVAACAPNPVAPTYSCSGASGAQVINFNDAYVTTQPGFSVTTAAGNGITITGDGHLRYIDTNASPVTSTSPAGDGISVHSGGDGNDVPGAVTISTAGAITGGARGIHARNDGEGNLSVTANGAVTGNTGDGIYAQNYGTDLTIVTGAGSEIDGGDEGIDAVNQGSGKLDITANGTVTGANDGLLAYNSGDGTDLLITTGAGSGIEGGDSGIYADNQGSGRLEITANGKVTGGDRDGIYGRNDGGDLIITANAGSEIDGGDEGIDAVNNGSGELRVTADGKVTGANDGLLAFNSGNGTHLRIVTGAQSEITGGNSGIFADNYGKGDLDIKAYGKVTGNDGDGIYARNSYDTDNGVDLKIVTGAQSSVTGSKYGINAKSYGTGDLVIRADGAVTGETEDGIFAHAYYGRNLTITTGAGSDISGSDDGIDAENTGIGDLTITVGGKVTGIGSDGIDALNEGVDLTITAEAGSVINAEYEGIQGDNRGTGNLTIIANGAITTISGGGNGIDAQNGYDGMDLTITTGAGSSISAGDDGIYAENRGLGNLTITVDGSVEGRGDDGIYADNEGANLTITTVAGSVVKGEDDGIDARHARSDGTFQVMVNGSVTGTEGYGINAANRADAFTDIKVSGSGLVQGNQAAIFAKSNAEQDISITNDGIVRNLSGKSFDVAIRTTGGATAVDNANQLIGTVQTGSFDDTVNNAGQWSIAGGTSNFGFEDEGDVVNNSGVLIAAVDPAGFGEETLIEDLEIFNNSGIVTLVDGAERDRLRFDEDATFNGQGGRLAIDAFLAGPIAGRSDMLFVDGDVSGVTYLTVNLTNPLGSTPNYEGIPVVVVAGDRAPESFALQDGVLNAGFFAWGLELNLDAYELVTLGLGAGAHEFAAGITGAQDMWQQTTGTLLQRQADLRPLIAAQQVTPVADFVTPVEPTPVGRVTPGLWFKGVGGWLDRDGEAGDNIVLDRKQTVFGGVAGVDFGAENLYGQGDALLFGLFGGYLTSKLDFDATNTEWQYDGPTVGVYATYLNDAFYADAVIKADFLDIDIDADDLAPGAEADTDATNIGGQIDAGYKIGFGQGAFIEPQASLSVLHTEIDDIDDIFGGSVEFEDETSVRGRLGLRLGADYAHDGVILTPDVTASVWQSFTGDNTVTVFAPLTPASDVSDDPGETVGDVSLGFSVTDPDGWSGFLRGNYQFAEDYEAFTGNAGVRYSW